MKEKFRAPRRALVVVFAIAAFAGVAAFAGASASDAAGPKTNPIHVDPLTVRVAGRPGAAAHFSCQDRPIDGSKGLKCYGPAQIQAAYGYSGLLASGVNGAGKTIVIVDAYSNPYVENDLKLEDATFGLPDAPSFTTLAEPVAPPTFDPNDENQVGWAEEITLDVEWAHAMAPGASIVLAEAASNQDADILATTKYVIDHHIGDVISQSFGEAETCVDPQILAAENALFAKATAEGVTVFASSGDSGASQFNCDGTGAILSASSPASDPNVTGVGGTTLNADGETGAYMGETAWTEQLLGCNPPSVAFDDINCSGGGFSTIYSRPAWQASQVKGPQPNLGRGVPDVAYNAGINGGVLTVCSVCTGGVPAVFLFGGTSAGSPQWSGLIADADQLAGRDIGNINQQLYQFSQGQKTYGSYFHDVTVGNNDVAEIGGQGYDAGTGWDPVTGLGTPNAATLLPALAKKG